MADPQLTIADPIAAARYRALVLAAAGAGPQAAAVQARQEPLPAVYDFSMTAPAT